MWCTVRCPASSRCRTAAVVPPVWSESSAETSGVLWGPTRMAGTPVGNCTLLSYSICEVTMSTSTSTAISSRRVKAPLVASPVAAAIGMSVVA